MGQGASIGRTFGTPALREHPATLQKKLNLLLSTMPWPEVRRGTKIDSPPLYHNSNVPETLLLSVCQCFAPSFFYSWIKPRDTWTPSTDAKTPGEGSHFFPVENHAFTLTNKNNEPLTKDTNMHWEQVWLATKTKLLLLSYKEQAALNKTWTPYSQSTPYRTPWGTTKKNM